MNKILNLYNQNLGKIYSKLLRAEKNYDVITFYSLKRKLGEFYCPSKLSSILIILPGYGFRSEKGNRIFRNFKFLLDEEIGFFIFNYNFVSFSFKDEDFFKFVRNAISEVGGIIEFLKKEYASNIDILGISLGGIIGFLIIANKKFINKGIFLNSGVDLELIIWYSLLRFKIRKDCNRKVCRKMHKIYKNFLKFKLYDEILNLPRKCFLYDPLTFIEFYKKKKILMINAIFDLIVPFYCIFSLKKKLKNLKLFLYPGTHLTLWLFFPFFRRCIKKFLKNGDLYRY